MAVAEVEVVSDTELVSASLGGNRDAFGQIVSRYQALICSLSYSSVGSLGHSEDLAQETFITAWKHLRHLREPAKLRSWLCGIARNRINNFLRREGREPLRKAEELGVIEHAVSQEPQPLDRAISREEEAILWRSLELIPEAYRETLVLFYREGHSIQSVAESLEVSEDAVKQRLSRGRKLLQEQVLAFVEGALERTAPGKMFTAGVLAALPAMTMSTKAAALGVAVAKAGASAKATAVTSMIGVLLSFPLAIFGNYIGYRTSLLDAKTEAEREFVKSFYRKLVTCILAFFVVFAALSLVGPRFFSPATLTSSLVGLALAYVGVTIIFSVWTFKRRKRLIAAIPDKSVRDSRPAWEYRSKAELLGWPLIHIRIGGGLAAQRKPVKAWFAAGDSAIGLVFAFGGIAIAPFSVGGCAVGLLPFGGMAIGPLAMGGLALGIWSFGGLAIGWQAYGGCAIAWNAAAGGTAVARDYALGALANAGQVNNDAAATFIRRILFFRVSEVVVRYMAWLNILWVLPMVLWWRATKRQIQPREQAP